MQEQYFVSFSDGFINTNYRFTLDSSGKVDLFDTAELALESGIKFNERRAAFHQQMVDDGIMHFSDPITVSSVIVKSVNLCDFGFILDDEFYPHEA